MQTIEQTFQAQITAPPKSAFRVWMRRAWWLATVGLFAVTIVALYANRFSPADYPVASLLALALIPLILANAVWLLLSLPQRTHASWLPAVALLWGGALYGHIFWQPGVPPVYRSSATDKIIKMLSFNAGNFYNHTLYSDAYFDKNANTDAARIKEWVAGQQADIKCLQEFFDDPQSEVFNTRQSIGRDMPYVVFPEPAERHDGKLFFGLIIFSKHPVVSQGIIMKKEHENVAIYADIAVHSDTIRVINAHLSSHNFGLQDFTRWHFRRYFDRAIERAAQADSIARFIARSPYPTIVCGDLNETGLSYAYRQLMHANLTDAFCEAGSGWGSTFRYSRWATPIRIDYQLAGPELAPAYYQAHPSFVDYEHNPVEVHYRLNAP